MVDYGWEPLRAPGTPVFTGAPTEKRLDPAATTMLLLAVMIPFTFGLSAVVALALARGALRNVAIDPEHRRGRTHILVASVFSGITVAALLVGALVLATP